jgi:hypothetical protein
MVSILRTIYSIIHFEVTLLKKKKHKETYFRMNQVGTSAKRSFLEANWIMAAEPRSWSTVSSCTEAFYY